VLGNGMQPPTKVLQWTDDMIAWARAEGCTSPTTV
jgi:hypothetical protein